LPGGGTATPSIEVTSHGWGCSPSSANVAASSAPPTADSREPENPAAVWAKLGSRAAG